MSKTIPELLNKTLFNLYDMFPVDSGTQTFKATYEVLKKSIGIKKFVSVTDADELTWQDDFVLADATGGAFTITLPPVAGLTGKELRIKKLNSYAAFVTVDGYDSETINGAANVVMRMPGEYLELICTGTAWVISKREFDTPWIAVGLAAGDFAAGLGTVTPINSWARRQGPDLLYRGAATCGTVTSGAATVNLKFQGVSLTANTQGANSALVGQIQKSATLSGMIIGMVDDGNGHFHMSRTDTGGLGTTQAGNAIFSTGQSFGWDLRIPITNWL